VQEKAAQPSGLKFWGNRSNEEATAHGLTVAITGKQFEAGATLI
jgi:hypothetical protein